MSWTIRRIIREINDYKNCYHELDVSFWPNNPDDVFSCTGVIMGPKDSVYDGGMFFVDIQYPEDYPYNPPKIEFITKIYNPCINCRGRFLMDILMDRYSPALWTTDILLSIQSMLLDFKVEYALATDIAYLYRFYRSKYECIARKWTALFAM